MDPWQVVPTAGLTAYRYRREIKQAWTDIVRTLRLAGSQVAVTGLAGAGKSVLFDHLSGDAFAAKYKLPGTSPRVEKKKAHGDRFFVVPGQDSAERLAALDRRVAGNKDLAGLVYVACNGYIQNRRPEAIETINANLSLEEFLELQRDEEVKDIEAVGEYFRRSVRAKPRKIWLLVVLNKYDLYFQPEEEQLAARQRYESRESEFGKRLAALSARIGSDNLSVNFWPVCGWPENFKYGVGEKLSSFDLEQRAYSVYLLSERLRGLTHGVSA